MNKLSLFLLLGSIIYLGACSSVPTDFNDASLVCAKSITADGRGVVKCNKRENYLPYLMHRPSAGALENQDLEDLD